MRNAQEDHLESEEAFILPEIYQRFSEEDQLQMVRRLLLDGDAEEPRWILDWVVRCLTPAEQRVLNDLEARFEGVAIKVS